MRSLDEMPFGTRRWVLVMCAVCAAFAEVAIAIWSFALLAGAIREMQLIALFLVAFVGGSMAAAGLAGWSVYRLWQRLLLREFGRALADADASRAERAIVSLAKIEARTPKGLARIWTRQFQMWCSLEDWSAARKSLGVIDVDRIEKLQRSRDAASNAFIALTLLETGDTDRAHALIDPAVTPMNDSGPASATARAVFGMVLNRLGRHGEAIEHSSKAVPAKPIIIGGRAIVVLAESLIAEGRHQEARMLLTPLAAKAPRSRLGQRAAQHLARTDGAYR